MSAEVTIALGVAGRVLANIICADNNPRLGAAFVGLSNGFLMHRAWVANTLLQPLTLLVLAAGLVFDHKMYGGFEETVTAVFACGLGVILADFGPDLWYEVVGEQATKDLSRELGEIFPFLGIGDDYSSDASDRSDAGSVVSKTSASSRRTARSGMTGTSVTIRPSHSSRPTRPRPTPHPASTITRSSRVTFDESSITQSQSSEADADDFETDTGFVPDGDESLLPSANGNGLDDLYMEPSIASGSSHTRVQMRQPASILRRLHIPGSDPTTLPAPRRASSQGSSTRTRLTSDGETTPRATTRPAEFSPLPLPSGFEPPPPTFPEPDLSIGYVEYSPQVIPPSEPTPDLSASIHLPEPAYFPAAPEHKIYEEGEQGEPSRLSRILNVPIIPHESVEQDHVEHSESPESVPLWDPRSPATFRRSRSRSPAGPRSQPPPHHEQIPATPVVEVPGPPAYISESYDDSTVDVRDLDKDTTIACIEEAWKLVEKKHHRRLNILVRNDDDEPQSMKNSTLHLMEDLENLRFNYKARPGIIIITSRSRG